MARLPYVIPFDPGFLGDGFQVRPPSPRCSGSIYDAGRFIDYIHYSLVMHRDRKTALFTAHNIDVSKKKSASRTGWDLDPRVERTVQTGPEAYANNDWDRGHLVRRDAVVWGDTAARAKDASDSTFYYTNAALQHARFNQDEWLKLEDWVMQTAGGASSRLCVFTGPIYTLIDQFDGGFRVPSAFWKIVVLRDPTAAGDDLSALGFVMKQNELWDDWNGAALLDLHLYQVGLAEIGGYAGLEFGELALLDEFEWRQARFRDRAQMAPVPITGPEDIKFFGDVRRSTLGVRALRVGGPEDAETPATTVTGPRPCGCDHEEAAQDERIEMLARQVNALREVVDTLLEAQPDDNRPERAGIREAFSRIVGGQITSPAEFPDCACIGDNSGYFCSGVLIHPRVVLTAAHCAPEIDKVFLAGRSISLAGLQGEVVKVERVIVHPDYDPNLVPSHDLAALVLARDAATEPVALATREEIDAEGSVMLVGFGYDHPTMNSGFGTKRKAEVPLTNLAGLAAAAIQQIEQHHGFDDEYEAHAGRKQLGVDSCNGDSGGPMYVLVGNYYRLAGVTSRAAFSADIRCGDGGIYTRITPYLSWLNTATGGLVGAGEAPPAPLTPTLGLYISAAQPNPSGSDVGREWVEVTNASGAPISLEGHSLLDRQGGKLALSGVLAGGATRRATVPAASELKLGNSGDDIVLKKGETVLHAVSYSSAGSGEIIRFAPPVVTPVEPGGGGTEGGGEGPLVDADPC